MATVVKKSAMIAGVVGLLVFGAGEPIRNFVGEAYHRG